MSTLVLTLLDGRGASRFDAVRALVAADASGSFGILAHHADMIAVLRYGLARFVDAAGTWRYLALPGGVLRVADGAVTLATVRYFLGEERDAIIAQFGEQLAREDSELRAARATLAEIEQTLLRRLVQLSGPLPEPMVRA